MLHATYLCNHANPKFRWGIGFILHEWNAVATRIIDKHRACIHDARDPVRSDLNGDSDKCKANMTRWFLQSLRGAERSLPPM